MKLIQTIIRRMTELTIASLFLTGCSNEFAFNEVFESCTPPNSSARFGKNIGPVITSPDANTPSSGTMTIAGTCAVGYPVKVKGKGIVDPVEVACSPAGTFSASVTLKGKDGKKEIDVAQPIFTNQDVMDRLCFNKDTVPPKVAIGGRSGSQAVNTQTMTIVGTCESGLDVEISGPQLINDVVTQCRNGRFEAEIEFTGPDGLKDIVAVQTDRAGNTGNDNEQYTMDMTPPIVTINAPAPMTNTRSTINISGTCEMGPRVLIQGAVSGAYAFDCIGSAYSGTITLSSPDGIKNVIASQTDVAGNTGTANRNFMRDATPPAVTITGPAANSITRANVNLVGSCETGLPVTIGGSGVSASQTVACTGGSFSANVALASPDGTKQVTATQTDASGNVGSDSRNFIRDGNPPEIRITAPAADSVWPIAISLQGSCESGLTVNISGPGILAPTTTSCVGSRFNSMIQFSAGDGAKTIQVAQTDAAGNTGTDSRRFFRDSSAPSIRITAPADGAYVQASATIMGTCEAGVNVVLSGNITSVTTACSSSGNFSQLVTFSAGDGNKNVVATQTDLAGNTASDSKTYVKDTVGPNVAITAPAANSVHQSSLTLVGTCETGLPVQLTGAGLAAPLSTACTAGGFSQLVNLSSGDGSKNIIATQTDAAGNSDTDNRTFIRDSSAPALAITSPAPMTAAQNGVTLQGTCEAGITVNLSGSGLASPATTACLAGGTFSVPIVFTAGEGNKLIQASQTDGAGNSASDSRTFVKDTIAPVVAFSTPAANAFVSSTATITGTCEAGISVVLSGTGLSSSVTTACNVGGNFTASVGFTAGDGAKAVIASQTDAAGNVGTANRSFVRDGTAPLVQITDPAANTVAQTGVTLQGNCETGLIVNITGSGLSAPMTTACTASRFSQAIVFSNGDGAKLIQVSQTDAAGNVGSDSRTFQKDSSAPAITINTPAANTRAQTGLTITGSCETGLNVLVNGSGVQTPVTVPCNMAAYSAVIVFTAGEGVKNVVASQTDNVGNTASANRDFFRDNTAPIVAITSPADNTYVSSSATISGTCENGSGNVNINGAGVATSVSTACTSGSFSASVNFTAGDGAKAVVASQTDAAGNVGTDTASFIRDSTAPVVNITNPTAGTVAQSGLTISGTCESGLMVNFGGSGITATTPVLCTAGTFTSAVTFTAGDGNKTVTASQTDAAGNTGTDSEIYVRDATGPNLTIASPAANTAAQTGLTVSGACESGYNVTLNGTGVQTPVVVMCSSSAYSAAILFSAGDGVKNVVANQTDGAGNTSTANRNFIRDTVAPAVAITAPAANSYVSASATISGTCENGSGNVTLNGAGVASSVSAACASGNFSASVTFTAGDGNKVVVATQTDAAGNAGSDTRTFVRDGTAPVVVITSPAANTVGLNGLTVGGTCETAAGNVTLNGAGVQTPVVTACSANTFSAAILFSNGDGAKVVTASQTDAAGNTGSNSRTFQRDTGAPAVTINSPAANIRAQTGVTVSGNCETGLTVVLNGSGVQTPVNAMCTSGSYSAAILFTAGEGVKNVVASQTDNVGNTGSANRDFIRDNTGPNITISSPAANAYVPASVTVTGTCETGGSVVVLSGTGVAAPVNATCTAGNYSGSVNLTSGDGSKNIVASQNDAAGNTGSANVTVQRDGTAPVITITAPAANAVVGSTLTLTGTCETGLTVNLSGTGLSSPSSTACTSGNFSVVITLTNNDGTKNIIASQTDAAGNTGSANRTFIRDTTAPVVNITSPASGTVAQNGLTVSGSCEPGLTVVLSGSGMVGTVNTNCTAGSFSAAISLSAGDGSKIIDARQTDSVGNIGVDSETFVRDATAPVVAITSPAANTSGNTGLTVSGICETGLTVFLTGGITPVNTSCASGLFTVAVLFTAGTGTKTVTATQTDAVGNVGSNSRNFMRSNNNGYDSFTSRGPGGLVDILFVDDNSASMDAEQIALGTRFSSFASALSTVNRQAGITTTDCQTGSPYNICGSLLQMTGRPAGEKVISAATPNFATVFNNTIQRPETMGCLNTGTCPAGREEGLKATIQAVAKRNSDNVGFFRSDADLAVVYLSDEDEQSNGPATATTPAQVVAAVTAAFGSTKKFSAYGIIIRPGDTACLNSQRQQLGANAFYGTFQDSLANMTGGRSFSICEPDYSLTLTQIGEDVTRMSKSYVLTQTPLPGTVVITYTPSWSSTFSVNGNRVTIDNPAPAGTLVEISYEF